MDVSTPTLPDAATPDSPPQHAATPKWHGGWLWLGALAVLCAGLGVAPVSRTQEARVLEVAREMLGSETHNWLIPRVNGRIRLQKPPLAYWLTAFSYQLLGVHEGTGRIPAAIAGAAAVGAAAAAAAWLFGRRAAFLAGAALAGSYLFFRHSRLAETDVLVTCFVTLAYYGLWRGYALTRGQRPPTDSAGPESPDLPTASTALPAALWFHAGAAAVGFAVISKGPPAAYPVLFLVLLAAVERQWRPLLRFVVSGAPITAALIALPWFLYVRQDPDYIQLVGDLKNSAGGGRGHSGLFVTYIPALFVATAPWSALWLVALIAAIRRWRHDWRLRGLVLWAGSILVPLSFWGNKQFHYLMPAMPPLMILVGWLLDEALKSASAALDDRLAGLTRMLWGLTAVGFAAGSPALVVAGKLERGRILPADVATAALVLAGLAVVGFVYRRRGTAAGVTAFAVVNVLLLAAIVGLWFPTLNRPNIRAIPPALASRYGDGPFAFVGKEDLPMVFHMRRIIPVVRSDEQIAALVARQPHVVAIEPISGTNKPRKAVVEEVRFKDDETIYRVGRIDPAALPRPTTSPATPDRDDDGE